MQLGTEAWALHAQARAQELGEHPGDQRAYTAGLVAVLLGALLVFLFWRKDQEQRTLAEYQAQDAARLQQRAFPHA